MQSLLKLDNTKRLFRHGRYYARQLLDDELTYYASSLSFYTIFTIIPLMMIVLSIATSMPSFQEYYGQLKQMIIENLMPVQSDAVTGYIDGFLKNAYQLSLVGFFMIIVASMLFFRNYEYIVSKVFHSPKRTIWQSITTYWTLLTFTPIAFGLSIYFTAKAAAMLQEYGVSSWINLMAILPYFIVWMVFFVIYKISAVVFVHTKAAFITSFLIAVVWSTAKNLFIYYVLYNKTYATIYGSFSVILFAFLWIYFSWIIFVYGLKLCYLIDRLYKYKAGKKQQQAKQ